MRSWIIYAKTPSLLAWVLLALFLTPVPGARSHGASGVRPVAAGETVQNLSRVLPCGKVGESEGVAPGKDLFRVDIDLRDYPNAVCNDGTPATMFVRRYSKKRDKNNWIIFLLGGGECGSAVECAERWCSINTGYGANKMSTSYLDQQGAARSIEGNGIFTPDASINNFAGWNQVFVYYCSSDDWQGSASNVRMTATTPDGRRLDYLINFRGADIVEAVIATLQREPEGREVAYRDSNTGEDMVLPDIDKAELVLLAGSSAGGNGVKNNVDRVGEILRKTNKHCKRPDDCSLIYLGLIDANYPPSLESVELTQASFCTGFPFRCTYEDVNMHKWNDVNVATYSARGDESCVNWHRQHSPGTEWMCADPQHVANNHLTTPLFIRFDLQDPNVGGKFVDQNLTTPAEFGRLTREQLLGLANLDSLAEEGSARSGGPRLRTPGVFGPQCEHHYGLSVSPPFFYVRLSDGGKLYSFHDALWEWVQGARTPQLVHTFTRPGPAPDCP